MIYALTLPQFCERRELIRYLYAFLSIRYEENGNLQRVQSKLLGMGLAKDEVSFDFGLLLLCLAFVE